MDDPRDPAVRERLQRRAFLWRSAQGLGSMALAGLMGAEGRAAAGVEAVDRGIVQPLHLRPRARRVIHLCMAGGPSHLETFDPKPELARRDGQPMPDSFTKGKPIAQLQGQTLRCLGPQHRFLRHGKSGLEISEVFPHLGRLADRLCVVRSMRTEQINHDPAHTLFNTGTSVPGKPSMGSWVLYGLGSMTQDLPGYVVLNSVGGGQQQPIAARQWHSGFLPARLQGVAFQSRGDAVHYLGRPPGVRPEQQRDLIDVVAGLDRLGEEVDPAVEARIRQYELAFRMQTSVPELLDVSDESPTVLERYGGRPGDGSYASNCLLARRLAERGVRFIQLYHRGWDHHGGVKDGVAYTAGLVDRPTAALIEDLDQRGLLDDTLVVFGGEFGRTPMAQGNGRDHHIQGYSMVLCGGGVRGGMAHGRTDELGYAAVEDVVDVRDFHATMLHQLGIDHRRLTYRYQGLDQRLTGVVEPARVVRGILA